MNDKLTQLLEKLATKLGTTADYLWKVLLVQAKISATQTLVFVLFVIAVGIFLFRLHKKFSKPFPFILNERYDNIYDKSEFTGVAMGVSLAAWIIMFFIAITEFSNIANGFFNPEYWALKEILDSL